VASSIAAQRVHATLQQVLADRGPLAADEALTILRQVAEELARWHAQGRLHRSIGLQTVISTGEGRVHLAPAPGIRSFGGPDVDEEACPWELQTERVVQVPDGLQAARAALADAGIELDPRRIDIYQSGVLLYRLLTGTSVIEYLRSPLSKSQLPPDLRTLVDGCLGSGGFASAEELSAALAERLGPSGMLPSQAANDSDTSPSLAGDEKRPDTSCGPAPREPAESAPLPFTKLAHYEIVGRIGRGGMGDVFRGYERELHREVAIKVLPDTFADDPDFVRRFRAEAAVAARIAHPNIVHVYFIGEDAGHLFFAMQYVAGQSLAELLAQRPQLEVDEALTIITQVLSGLAAAHAQGVVHRDIKPANILLDAANRRALLGDFGLVKRVSSGENKTATGVIMGTVDYLSPEQGRGKPVDARSDLYSVGVLLYRMLSGRLPFTADSATAMIFQHVYEPPVPLTQVSPNTPAPLAEIVSRLLAKRPEDRYQTADDVRAALQEFAATWMPTGGSPIPARDGRVAAPATPDVLSDVLSDAGESPAAAGPRTAIIRDLAVEDLPRWPAALAPSRVDGWWQRVRDRMLATFQARAPRLAEQWLTTQQHVDGAVAVYEERYAAVNQLVGEAEAVLRDLSVQAACNLQAAQQAERRAEQASGPESAAAAQCEQRESQQAAEELLALKAEQEQELQGLRGTQRELGSRLQQLRSQRTILAARLQTAQAEARTHGGGQAAHWRQQPVWAAVAAGLILVLLSAFLLSGWWSPTGEPVSVPPAGVYGALPSPLLSTADGQPPMAGNERSDNGLAMTFCWCPPGRFTMGSSVTESGRNPNETQTAVTLTRGFWMGKYEVTQDEWTAVMGTRPWQGRPYVREGGTHAASYVNWAAAMAFCWKLTAQERQAGRLSKDDVYTLPTEAQWEYACRAGSTTSFGFGEDPQQLHEYAWFQQPFPREAFARPVGQKRPNAWGLHDMHGNVLEWCRDAYQDVPPGGADPLVEQPGRPNRAYRGGGWSNFPRFCRSAHRGQFYDADAQSHDLGFRVARMPVVSGLELIEVEMPPGKAPAQVPAAMPDPQDLSAVAARAQQAEWAGRIGRPIAFTNQFGIEMLLIPPGSFLMGSPPTEPGHQPDEQQVEVTLTQPFYLGRTEITQQQWEAVMGTRPWQGHTGVTEGPSYPADHVSWLEAVEFCRRLTEQQRQAGQLPDGWAYRLPTEAQWEHACRAGSETPFYFGTDIGLLTDDAWYHENTKGQGLMSAQPVGLKQPNAFGLHDMYGNVWEWCADGFRTELPGGTDPEASAIDPASTLKIMRGGGWDHFADQCRSANRERAAWRWAAGSSGLRVALIQQSPLPGT
jgi:formylglycine-generating enzyme required for sulfatase activity/serine/threonine protein kinase